MLLLSLEGVRTLHNERVVELGQHLLLACESFNPPNLLTSYLLRHVFRVLSTPDPLLADDFHGIDLTILGVLH